MDEKIMRVTISVGGRWHAFDLAKQLLKRNALTRLITSFPKMKTREWGIPDKKVKSLPLKEILERGYGYLPRPMQNIFNPQFFLAELYDSQAARYLRHTTYNTQHTNLLVVWSSFALHTLYKAKQLGLKTILEHGSTHIEYQRDILQQEYERFGIKPESGQLPHPKIIEKELKEYQEAEYISIPSGFVKQTFLDKGIPDSKLLQIPYGVDLSHFRQVPKQDNVFRIVFAGSLTLRKGVPYLLQAFSELSLKNTQLVLYGAVSDEIKPLLQKYQNENVKIQHVAHTELHKYYSQGSVFVLLSIEEGLARVLFEAMACGLPVIATTNTGAQDLIENGKEGYVIPSRDIGAFKEKLLYMYEHQEIAKQMGLAAKQKVQTGFSWDDYGNKIEAAYEKILKSGIK